MMMFGQFEGYPTRPLAGLSIQSAPALFVGAGVSGAIGAYLYTQKFHKLGIFFLVGASAQLALAVIASTLKFDFGPIGPG